MKKPSLSIFVGQVQTFNAIHCSNFPYWHQLLSAKRKSQSANC